MIERGTFSSSLLWCWFFRLTLSLYQVKVLWPGHPSPSIVWDCDTKTYTWRIQTVARSTSGGRAFSAQRASCMLSIDPYIDIHPTTMAQELTLWSRPSVLWEQRFVCFQQDPIASVMRTKRNIAGNRQLSTLCSVAALLVEVLHSYRKPLSLFLSKYHMLCCYDLCFEFLSPFHF